MATAPNKQLQRTVTPRRGDDASAPPYYALAPRVTRYHAAAELRRWVAEPVGRDLKQASCVTVSRVGVNMGDITKQELKDVVFITAHNSGSLTDDVQREIDAFDPATYRQFLNAALERRENADATGAIGGGNRSAAFLREALEHLDHIIGK